MTEKERIAEAYEIVSIIAANVLEDDNSKCVELINKLRENLKPYIKNYNDYTLNTSIKKTKWENYRPNLNALIDLAIKYANK